MNTFTDNNEINTSILLPIDKTNENIDNNESITKEEKEQEQEEHISKKLKVNNNNNNNNETNEQKDLNKNKNNNKYKQSRDQAIYGNYHGYYNYRNGSIIEQDNRMKYLCKELFFQKRCLDIGCNSGDIVFKISKHYNPTHITGIDIDKFLINKAYHQLSLEQQTLNKNNTTTTTTTTTDNTNNSNNNTNTNNTNSYAISTTIIDSSNLKIDKKDFIPISFRMISDGIISNQFPHNISFYCQNFLYTSKIVDKPNAYDVITALSISKWVHLNWGDAGIKKFLIKIYSLLKDGGIFLFEPQPFKGYPKRKNLSELINKNFSEIKFKPDQFNNFLIETVGFKSFEFLNASEAKSKGFDRPLYKFIK